MRLSLPKRVDFWIASFFIIILLISCLSLYALFYSDLSLNPKAQLLTIKATLPFLILSLIFLILNINYSNTNRSTLKRGTLSFLFAWSCYIWLDRIIFFANLKRGILESVLIALLYLVLFSSAISTFVLFLRHPNTVRFLRFHKGLIIIILVALLVRLLMIISFPFLVVNGDGGDGIYFFERIWMMARGIYQGNLQFVTGYPFFMSFLGILLIRLGKSILLLLCQHIISVCAVILLYHIVWLHTRDKLASFLAGIIAALSFTDALWAHRSRPVFLGTFLSVAALWAFSVWLKKYRDFLWLSLTGVLLSCATLVRNFPVVFLGCFLLIILFLKETLKRKVLYCVSLLGIYSLIFYSYLYCVQYRSTGMFAMRGMGIGIFLMSDVSYKGNTDKIPFTRGAGEFTNRMVAYTHYIKENLPPMPMEYWTANLFNRKESRAPAYMTEELLNSLSYHSSYQLPVLEEGRDVISVDKVEFVYYLGVPRTKRLFEGYGLEQIRIWPFKYLQIVFRRIINSYRIHRENFVIQYGYFPQVKNIKILKKNFFGFYRVQWPSSYQSDARIPFTNLTIMQFIEWIYNHVLYDWWLYLITFIVLIPDILRWSPSGRLSAICILLTLAFIISHAFICEPFPRHMSMLEPFYKILFGLALYRVVKFTYFKWLYRNPNVD